MAANNRQAKRDALKILLRVINDLTDISKDSAALSKLLEAALLLDYELNPLRTFDVE